MIDYTIGDDPAARPYGHAVLRIELEGEAVLRLQTSDGDHAWAGQVDQERLFELMDALDAAGFPAVPEDTPAQAARRRLTLDLQGNVDSAEIPEQLEGYKDVFAILDSIVVQLSGGVYEGAQDTLAPSVTDRRPL